MTARAALRPTQSREARRSVLTSCRDLPVTERRTRRRCVSLTVAANVKAPPLRAFDRLLLLDQEILASEYSPKLAINMTLGLSVPKSMIFNQKIWDKYSFCSCQ